MPAGARKVKPRLSFANIFNMSFGFLGIQFGFALQTSNASADDCYLQVHPGLRE